MSDDSGRRHPGDRLFEYARQQKEAQRATSLPAAVGDHQPIPDDVAARYARKALDAEVNMLAATGEGSRNHQLNKSAYNLGQLVGAGMLDEQVVRDRLVTTALAIGLDAGETANSIRSGIGAGKKEPRTPTLTPVPNQVTEVSPDQLEDAPDTGEVDAFWSANPWHTHIYASAKARRCSPWAVLGVVLARVVTLTPPGIVLPPIVGGQASLNLFVGLVGPSGSGKGAAERVAADCLHMPYITSITTGSGEGIGHAYRKRNRDGTQDVVNTAVLFSVPEIDTLSALGNRKGATLMPELRRGWSGEALGFAYADPSRRLLVEAHSYRMCMVAGIQPTRAGALLDDADGGTPQRFLWMPATDRYAPDVAPDCPEPLVWREPKWSRHDLQDTRGRIILPVCETARTTIDAAHLARTRGEGDALDGHLLLNQLKTAAALAILDGRLEVSDVDWQLADVVIRWSTATRNGVESALRRAVETRNMAQAVAEAERAEVVESRAVEAAHKRVCRSIMRRLADDESVTRSALRKSLVSSDRGVFDAAIDDLIRAGQIEQEGGGYGTRFRRL